MAKSIKYLLIVFVVGLLFSLLADWFLQKGFEKTNDDVIGKLNEIINDTTNYEILCFGSSRALAHINPEIISEITGKSTYNAGLNGGCLIDFNALFKVYLQKHPVPKTVVIHVDEFTFETSTISELPRYFPFIGNDLLYENLVKYNNTFIAIRYVRFLRLMYYYDLLKWIAVKSWLHMEARDEYRLVNGYRVNASKWNAHHQEGLDERLKIIKEKPLNSPEEIKEGKKLFSEMLELCKQHHIQLIFTSSPEIGADEFAKYDSTVAQFEAMAKNYNASFLWMHHDQWSPDEHYYDFTHMNNVGADRYSKELGAFIQKQN
jgi:hypothetical protein